MIKDQSALQKALADKKKQASPASKETWQEAEDRKMAEYEAYSKQWEADQKNKKAQEK